MKNVFISTVIFSWLCSFCSIGFSQTVPLQGAEAEKAGTLDKTTNETIAGESKGAVKKAKVYFIEPKDKATVSTKFKVKMGVDGMKLLPAGQDPDNILAGHHHLLIDMDSIQSGQPIPNDATHLHFGKAQTETEVTLKPGSHTLTLQFADGAHRSFGKDMSQTIHIQVK